MEIKASPFYRPEQFKRIARGWDGGRSVSAYRSDDPLDFGAGEDPGKRDGCDSNLHAPKIVVAKEGNGYISKIHEAKRGHKTHTERLP